MDQSGPPPKPAPSEPVCCPVVAIGASAGGLSALATLLGALRGPLAAAVVVVTHAAPDVKSHLAEILATTTALPVRDIVDGAPLTPGLVQVLPAGADLVLAEECLRLVPRESGPLHRPIDRFLVSLARGRGARTVAVILSGAGSDGSRGLREVHAAGGLVLVQDPDTAEHDGMPASAIETGLADAVLPITEMGQALSGMLPRLEASHTDDADTPQVLARIVEALFTHTGHDFSGYKPSTLLRRIHKRLLLTHVADPAAYAERVETDPEERTRLFHDLLINVTAFFRDPPAFQALDRAVPSLLVGRSGKALRIWVAGCATGEEAYSVAMLLSERCRTAGQAWSFKIFASDIDQPALDQARKGFYPAALIEEIGAARLREFFRRDGEGYQVLPPLRETIVFARHDLLRDPPFLGMDLIVCRNFLIYLTPELQAKTLSIFSHALRHQGLLLLGSAETIGPQAGLFEVLDKKWRLYRRKSVPVGLPPDLPARPPRLNHLDFDPVRHLPVDRGPNPEGLAESLLLRRYAPSAALVDTEGRVVRLSGDTRPFLHLPEGSPTMSLHKLVPKLLRPSLREAFQAALDDGAEHACGPVCLEGPDRPCATIRVTPVADEKGRTVFLLVAFERQSPPAGETPVVVTAPPEQGELVVRYETELERATDQLQRTVESYEALNEELKASNEELLSMNEELQTSNEEMDASREELQSLNEELSTVNAELQTKIDELAAARAFVENLLGAIELPILVLDAGLRVIRYTEAALTLFHLVPTDEGRPAEQVKARFEADRLAADCARGLGGEITLREIHTEDGRWFLQRCYPSRDPTGAVSGVVLTFSEVTTLKEAEEILARGKEELERLVTSRTEELQEKLRLLDMANVVVRDLDARITLWNTGAEELYGYTKEEALGQVSYRLLRTIFPEPYESVIETLKREGRWTGELRKFAKDGREIHVATLWQLGRDATGRPVSILEVGNDVTERNRLEEKARRWNRMFESAAFGLAHASVSDNTLLEVNPAFARQRGYAPEELTGRSMLELHPPEDRKRIEGLLTDIDMTGHGSYEGEHVRKDGSRFPVFMEVTTLRTPSGRPVGRVAYALDITERKKAEETIQDMARFPSENPHPVLRVGADMLVMHANTAGEAFLREQGSGPGLPFPTRLQPDLAKVLESGEPSYFETDIREHTLALSASPVPERGYVNIYGMDVTARKEAERALAASEERFHSLFTCMGEGVCVLEVVRDDTNAIVDYRILEVNPSYESILDIPRDRAVGSLVREVFGLAAPPNLDVYARIVATGHPESFETFFQPQQKYLRISAFSPQPDRFAVVFQDVTERKLSEEAIRKNEALLRLVVDAAPDAIIIQSEGRFAYLNPAARRLFAIVEPEEMLDQPVVEAVHPDDRELVAERIRLANEKRVYLGAVPVRYRRSNGTFVPVEAVSAPFEYQGRAGSLVFARDISERLHAEEEKRKARDLAEAVATVREAYLTNRPSEEIFDAALTEILRLTESRYGFIAELRTDDRGRDYQQCLAISNIAWDGPTRKFYDAHAPGGLVFYAMDGLNAAAVACGHAIIANNATRDPRASRRLPAGHPPVMAFLGLPLFFGGECLGSMGLANREGGYDEALAKHVRPLLDVCAQIIERLRTERRLVAAKQAAEAASLAKSEFLANMSHEIRTPLNGILGMLQLMQTTTLDGEQTEYVGNAVTSSRRLTRLLSDILDLSLVESGKLSIRQAPLAPADLRAAVLDLFARPARDKGLTLTFDLDPRLPQSILADEVRLRQILFNLVGNAVKFTDQGTVSAWMGPASLAHDAGFRLLIQVADSGIGIADDKLAAIFEPFGQVEGVYVRRFGGAGLGLSIVRRLVALMGGEIAVDNQEGLGTTFSLSLPLPPESRPALLAEPKSRPRPLPANLRLLLAEDDAVSMLSFRRMLEKAGYRVDVAEDGAKVLALVAERDYDCILMDVQMPVMDGVAATKAIRDRSDAKAAVPIIAMTAYAMAGDREKFLAAGMNGYVGKPVDMDDLRQAIQQAVSPGS